MANPNPNIRSVAEGEKPSIEQEKSSWIIGKLRTVRDTVIGLGLWTLFPLVVAGCSYLAGLYFKIPGLTQAASWDDLWDLRIYPVGFVALIAAGIWGFINVKFVRDPQTKVFQLRREVGTSIIMAFAWMFCVGGMVFTRNIYLVFIVPVVVQAADGLQSALEAINNAAQKMRLDDESKR